MDTSNAGRLFSLVTVIVLAAIFFSLGVTAASLWSPQYVIKSPAAEQTSESILDDDLSIVKIPINSATKEDLMMIKGVGEVYAQRIIDYRDSIGGFTKLEQLKNVKGIGEIRYNEWVIYFTLD